MKQGDNFIQASEIADELLESTARTYQYDVDSEGYAELKKIVPPYAGDKFPDKWKKLCEDKPSHTLVAHLSVDTYSHIHEPVAEHFANTQVHSRYITTERSNGCYLVLSSTEEQLRNEFAVVCAQFIEPGQNGVTRQSIVNRPLEWLDSWRKLLGNADVEQQTYNVIAEMQALYTLFQKDRTVKWVAIHAGTQDIENAMTSYKVKNTLRKYETQVTISSQNQLKRKQGKRLYLYFCRMEKSMQGDSINDMVRKLETAGYPADELEKQLKYIGFENGTNSRNEKYRISDERKYTVDDKFQTISSDSFINGQLPDHVCKITYTIDLNGISYTEW